MKPTVAQCESLYKVCYWITEKLQLEISLVRLDERTGDLYIQYGPEDERYFVIKQDGRVGNE